MTDQVETRAAGDDLRQQIADLKAEREQLLADRQALMTRAHELQAQVDRAENQRQQQADRIKAAETSLFEAGKMLGESERKLAERQNVVNGLHWALEQQRERARKMQRLAQAIMEPIQLPAEADDPRLDEPQVQPVAAGAYVQLPPGSDVRAAAQAQFASAPMNPDDEPQLKAYQP